MYFNASRTQGAVGAVIPEKSGGGEQPGQSPHLNKQQFPGKPGAPAEGAGAEAGAAGGEAAAAGGAEAGAASLTELAPLLLL